MKIAVFTSSSPIGSLFPKRAQRAIDFFAENGHSLKLGKLFYANDKYRSGSIKQRADEINDLIKEKVDILMSAIGGMNTNSILPYIDYDLLNKNVKVVCGFSDTTALLNAILVHCPDVKVIYGGALFPNFGEFEKDSSMLTWNKLNEITNADDDWVKIISSAESFLYQDNSNWEDYVQKRSMVRNKIKTFNPQKVESVSGKIFGGNLSTITGIMGSKYFDYHQGEILFIEDSEKKAEEIERFFSLLKLNDIFSNLKAIILGTHNNFNDQNTGKKPIDILVEVLGEETIPIIYDVPCSHDKPMNPIALNWFTKIDFIEKKIIQKYE